MAYVILITDLETNEKPYFYREQGKVVVFPAEYQAVSQKYMLLETKAGRTKIYDVQYRRNK